MSEIVTLPRAMVYLYIKIKFATVGRYKAGCLGGVKKTDTKWIVNCVNCVWLW